MRRPKPKYWATDAEVEVGPRLRQLREQAGLSMRQLAAQADVAASYVSSVEAGRISPTIGTLRKLLLVLGEDIAGFFAAGAPAVENHVFRGDEMREVADTTRRYVLLLPRRHDIRCEMLHEELYPSDDTPPFEDIGADLAGHVLDGEVLLEIEGQEARTLRAGDAFYVPEGQLVRGRCSSDTPARLITVIVPPRY